MTRAEAAPPVATSGAGPVRRTLAILELVAERGGASAREIAEALDVPLPTVYRLAGDLVASDYLVHIRQERRYELGYKLHRLGLSLHDQIGVSRQVRERIVALHHQTGCAAYLCVRRGAELALVFVADSPQSPRLQPMTFGFHEAPHATAFGKVLLADMDPAERRQHLGRHGLRPLTTRTVVDPEVLDRQLHEVARLGVGWEFAEFLEGRACAAVPVRRPDGSLLGCVAISTFHTRLSAPDRELEHQLRRTASEVGAYFLGGRAR